MTVIASNSHGTTAATSRGTAVILSALTGKPVVQPRPGATPSPTPAAGPNPSPTPVGGPGLHVNGNHYVNGNGQTVLLHGVLHNGPEYACGQGWGIDDGPGKAGWNNVDQVFASMVSNDNGTLPHNWPINTFVIMLDEDCWLGINGIPAADSGQNYISYIKSLVTSAEKYGIYPTLAYGVGDPGTDTPNYYDSPGGQPPMANNDHTPLFWEEVANTFKNDPDVIFRLEEEPRPLGDSNTGLAAWQCWSQGDVQYLPSGDNAPPTPPTVASSNTHCPGITDDRGHAFQAVGMQSMINIVRGTGAENVIQVPGVAYADALSCGETVSPTTCGFLDNNPADMSGCAPSQSPCTVAVHDTLNPPQLGADTDNYPDIGQICGTANNVPRSVTCFNTMYGPVAAVMPYDSGETGIFNPSNPFPVEQAYIDWMDSHAGNYYFAAWTVAGSYNMVSSYAGTPISPWGTWVYYHMTAAATP